MKKITWKQINNSIMKLGFGVNRAILMLDNLPRKQNEYSEEQVNKAAVVAFNNNPKLIIRFLGGLK